METKTQRDAADELKSTSPATVAELDTVDRLVADLERFDVAAVRRDEKRGRDRARRRARVAARRAARRRLRVVWVLLAFGAWQVVASTLGAWAAVAILAHQYRAEVRLVSTDTDPFGDRAERVAVELDLTGKGATNENQATAIGRGADRAP